jgi:hypothetical protein
MLQFYTIKDGCQVFFHVLVDFSKNRGNPTRTVPRLPLRGYTHHEFSPPPNSDFRLKPPYCNVKLPAATLNLPLSHHQRCFLHAIGDPLGLSQNDIYSDANDSVFIIPSSPDYFAGDLRLILHERFDQPSLDIVNS